MLKDAKKITNFSDWISHTMENIFWEKWVWSPEPYLPHFLERDILYIYIFYKIWTLWDWKKTGQDFLLQLLKKLKLRTKLFLETVH